MAPPNRSLNKVTLQDAAFVNRMILNMSNKRSAKSDVTKKSKRQKTDKTSAPPTAPPTASKVIPRPVINPKITSNVLLAPAPATETRPAPQTNSSEQNVSHLPLINPKILSHVPENNGNAVSHSIVAEFTEDDLDNMAFVDPKLVSSTPSTFKLNGPLTQVGITKLQQSSGGTLRSLTNQAASGLTARNLYPNAIVQTFGKENSIPERVIAPAINNSEFGHNASRNSMRYSHPIDSRMSSYEGQQSDINTGRRMSSSSQLQPAHINSEESEPIQGGELDDHQSDLLNSDDNETVTPSDEEELIDNFEQQRTQEQADDSVHVQQEVNGAQGVNNNFQEAEDNSEENEVEQEDEEEQLQRLLIEQNNLHGPNCCSFCSGKVDLCLEKLNEALLLLKSMNEVLLLLKARQNVNTPVEPMRFDLLPDLPVQDVNSLKEFSENLHNNDLKVQFENKLSLLVSSTLQITVAKMMSSVMTDAVANSVTWCQLKTNSRKECVIHDLHIINVVTAFLQAKSEYKDQSKIHDVMAEWVRRAPDRISNTKKKIDRKQRQEDQRRGH